MSPPPKRRPATPGSMFACAIIFLVLGVGTGAWIAYSAYEGLASLRWKTAPGSVVHSWLDTAPSRSGEQYTVRVRYRYEVNGTEYTNDRGSYPEEQTGDRNRAYGEIEGQYAPGQACTVHYDPSDPGHSCLRPGVNWFFTIFYSVATLFFLALAATFGWRGVHARHRGSVDGQPGPAELAPASR